MHIVRCCKGSRALKKQNKRCAAHNRAKEETVKRLDLSSAAFWNVHTQDWREGDGEVQHDSGVIKGRRLRFSTFFIGFPLMDPDD